MSLLDVDITVERGRHVFSTDARVTGVFGRSGAGKTTLLHALAGLLPARGSITVAGETLLDTGRGVARPIEARRIGIVFQDDRLFPHRTVRQNLRYGMGRAETTPGLEEIAHLLELIPLLERQPGTLSGGERRRVAIARAVLARPRLLLLDEPLVSLDTTARRHVLELLERLDAALDVPMLHVSHDVAELLRHAHDLLIVDHGSTIAHGTMATLAGDPAGWALLRDSGAVNALAAEVAHHDAAAGLTHYVVRGRELRLAGPLDAEAASGDRRSLAIGTRDIALARARVDGISIRNQVPGRITRVVPHADHAIVEVDCGATLLVEVSHQTVTAMSLKPDLQVVCLVKSNAVRTI